MKILHLPSTFFPDFTGGKEVFVYNIIKNSQEATHLIVLHKNSGPTRYQYKDINIEILPLPRTSSPGKAYYSRLYDDVPGFEELLDTYLPDIVHFHDQSSNASLSHLRICKRKGIRTLLTYHSPGQSCLQHALIYEGQKPCDGWINRTRCTACRYMVRGVPKLVANVASHLSLPIDPSGKFILRNSTTIFEKSWREFYNSIDLIQVHAHWVTEVLNINKVSSGKIRFVEMGGPVSLPRGEWSLRESEKPLRLAFVGRCSDSKGIHVLINAMKRVPPELPVELHFFGPAWDETQYGIDLLNQIAGDVRFKPSKLLLPEEVVKVLSSMDACVIPSLWPETGPFTVFDSFAAGLPVIGTDHAGITQRVRNNVDGLLFEWGNADELAEKIMLMISDADLVKELKKNIVPNRTFAEMGKDFLQLYTSLLK